MYHTPVLLESTLEHLALPNGGVIIDATLGDAGHTMAMLKVVGARGRILGFDASPVSIERAKERLGDSIHQVTIVNENFGEMQSAATENGFENVDGILMDLGVASWQLDEPKIGLSFQREEPLDMRLNPRNPKTAFTIINRSSLNELTDIFETYGDVRRGRPLAQRIVDARSKKHVETTFELVEIIGTRSPGVLAPIFQALRIAVNNELQILESALYQAVSLLKPAGRLVVISYHSGEDRIVKNVFRQLQVAEKATILTPKPIVPTELEQKQNSRSRSAKLRSIGRV